MSPTVPRKPSGLGLNNHIHSSSSQVQTQVQSQVQSQPQSQATTRSPHIQSGTVTPNSEKRELPFKTLFPRTLLECMQMKYGGFKVLLLDVRTREEFKREHINIDTVCIEPSVLLRDR